MLLSGYACMLREFRSEFMTYADSVPCNVFQKEGLGDTSMANDAIRARRSAKRLRGQRSRGSNPRTKHSGRCRPELVQILTRFFSRFGQIIDMRVFAVSFLGGNVVSFCRVFLVFKVSEISRGWLAENFYSRSPLSRALAVVDSVKAARFAVDTSGLLVALNCEMDAAIALL